MRRPDASMSYVSGTVRLRDLAHRGRLAEVVAGAGEIERRGLAGAAYEMVWPIVFARLTRPLEFGRGHPVCATGVDRLADDCLDGFHDDVEAVVEDVLTHCRNPVQNLEAWIAGRVRAATVDAHRRRRGERGALQRPRLPGWLAAALGHDRWLTTLATHMLVWVGVDATAGNQLWPVESWAADRAAGTGDWPGSTPATVAQEIDTVLSAMRRRPQWYELYVERPLGRKRAPLAVSRVVESPVVDPYASADSELCRLAGDAVAAIDHGRRRGEDTRTLVVEVIRRVFGGTLTAGLEQAPHAAADPLGGVTGALADAVTVNRIVGTVRAIIDEAA